MTPPAPQCLCEQCEMTVQQCKERAPATSAEQAIWQDGQEQVLDKVEKIVSERIAELKSWIKLAKITVNQKREHEILPILGENQALLAQIKELRQQESHR